MTDQLSPSFEHEALEADIKTLAQEIQRRRERPESKNLSERELLKQAIKGLPSVAPPSPPPEPVKQPPSKSPLPAYAQNMPAEIKLEIEYLIDLAFHQGVAKATAEAKESSNFVLDAFHDALAGKLYPEFQKRGILK
jgi:hypothetical protein